MLYKFIILNICELIVLSSSVQVVFQIHLLIKIWWFPLVLLPLSLHHHPLVMVTALYCGMRLASPVTPVINLGEQFT